MSLDLLTKGKCLIPDLFRSMQLESKSRGWFSVRISAVDSSAGAPQEWDSTGWGGTLA